MIKTLGIRNFKCWVDNEIHFSPLTILAGGNAVGKSSIIQSLLLLKEVHKNPNSDEISLDNISGMNLGLPKNIIAKDRTSESITLSLAYKDASSETVILDVGDDITQPLSLLVTDKKIALHSPFSNFQYLNAERRGPRITSNIKNNANYDVGNQGEYTTHTMHQADLMKYPIHKDLQASNIAKFSANCEAWLDIIIPGTEFEIKYYEEVNKASVKFKNLNNSSDAYVPTATGFGITYVLPIIVAGLILSSKNNALLIVENPEAHLHPYGQSKIGQFLALLSTCGVQVIVETHSEHVINGARLQLAQLNKTENLQVNYFYSESKEIKIKTIPINEHGELAEWPKGFFDQSKDDLRKLLELRLCKD